MREMNLSNRFSIASHDDPRPLVLWSGVEGPTHRCLCVDHTIHTQLPRVGTRHHVARDCPALRDGGMGEESRGIGGR
jgi:hypothetical protein